MGVLDDLAAENAEFVSLRRLLETIRTSEGCSLQQAADWLSRKINRTGESENLTWCKLEPGFGIVGANNQHSDFAWLGLQRVVNDGAFADGWALADGADHYELLGFRASEIYPILEQCGVRLSGTATVGPAVKPAPVVPDWMRALIPRNQITLGEAAAILAGFAPMGSEPWSYDELSEIAPWRKALIDAIDHADIVGGTWRSDRDEQPLSHADIRAWCSKWGHTWPLPQPNPLPSTESEATAEIVRLREIVDSLEKNIAERDQKIINVKGLSNARIALLEADLASKVTSSGWNLSRGRGFR
ncbi:hypothetical protein [Ralstonia chuxiongensis]|uniref:hypothetical protein n=1 Tax=Ralstonia chuxiongensis TaxID=2957504 RepID=UPI0028F674D5|nr:hypothetical protein [Ralstonia chuxiongensis]CAJ0773070.1 hypothetical protein R8510_03259 [Ralstonia chuxiongensis]